MVPAAVRIFAWGNRGRRDDGVGLALAEELQSLYAPDPQVSVQQYHQLGPEVVDELRACRLAVFVDARVGSPAAAVAVTRVRPAESGELASHHCSPEALLALGQALGLVMPETYLVSIHAQDVGYGDQLSEDTARAMCQARHAVANLIASRRRCAAAGSSPLPAARH